MTARQLIESIQSNFKDILEAGFVIDDEPKLYVQNSDIDPDLLESIIMRLYFVANDKEKGVKYFINQYQGGRYIYFCRLNNGVWLFLLSESEAFSKLHFYVKFIISEVETLEMDDSVERVENEIDEKTLSAKRIQEILFQNPADTLPAAIESFLWHQPKDALGGDYFWSQKTRSGYWVVIGDCTGHSVEGALATVSVLSIINQVFNEKEKPHWLIKNVHTSLDRMQKQKLEEGYGIGNEMLVLKIDFEAKSLEYSGTGLPIYFQSRQLRKFKTKSAHFEPERVIKFLRSRKVSLPAGTQVFTHTDGIPDQLNDKGKRLGQMRLNDQLKSTKETNADKIKNILNSWKGTAEQTDDILAFGFKVEG